jgi:hypothetical protein
MKIIELFLLIFVVSCCTKDTQENNALLQFEENLHDFREIPNGIDVNAIFKFSNTGKNPLLIYDVKTSCGCTVPEWTKEAIAPNEERTIKVNYDAKHFGKFSKTITVFYNGKNSPKLLTIKGEVVYTKEEEEAILK